MSPDYGINYAVAKIYIGRTVVLGILSVSVALKLFIHLASP